ncbi:MAG: hypothetical protein ACREXS_18815, partial [Gammaproteobacteria bacterium]
MEQYQQRLLASCLFDVLDRPMKALGAKKLVEDVATVCIKATCHKDRTREEAECEARARICGLSLTYPHKIYWYINALINIYSHGTCMMVNDLSDWQPYQPQEITS